MWQQYKKKIIAAIAGLSLLGGGGVAVNNEMLGGTFEDAKWININSFSGYVTDVDPSKVPDGANPMGQNTTANSGDRISVRNFGYQLFPDGDATTTQQAIKSLHTFRKRSGENILLRNRGTLLEYFDESGDTWETLKSGLSDGARMAYADFNINTDLQSYVYFGNAVDPFSRWTGNHSNLSQALAVNDSYVYVDSVAGFTLAADTIVVCGVELAYTSASTTLNRFALTASSTVACDDGKAVAEAIETYPNNPRGNIYLVNDNRLFISGVASTTQAVFFSTYGNATTYLENLVADGTDSAAGIFNLGEGGGAVTAMAADESSIYIFKRSTIRTAKLTDTIYALGSLKPYDGKSQTIGAVSPKSSFSGGNGIYFITPDRQIMSIGREPNIDFPQVNRISSDINQTVDSFNFDDSAGIVFNDKAFFSFKSDFEVGNNNTVLVWNLKDKMWESPIVGWTISDFAVYDDGTGEALYMGDSITSNVYKVTDGAQDGDFEVVSNWRSKQFTFGNEHSQKQVLDMFVEGYISQSTELTISMLLDEDGYTQVYSTTIAGTDTDIIYDSTVYNAFGLNPFGTTRFGSQDDDATKKKFRVYLGKDFRPAPFYNMQIEFASDGANQDWEVLDFGVKVRQNSQAEKRELYKSFK